VDPVTDAVSPEQLLVCAACGVTPPESEQAAARISWTRSTEGGRTTWICERCSRQNVRSIEGKLDAAWW